MTDSLARPILVLEDCDEDFDTLDEVARGLGVTNALRRALDGEAMLELFHAEIAALPVLILIDLNTPGMDGRDVLTELKGDPARRTIPVVVLTTSTSDRDVRTCYERGANAYHAKTLRHEDYKQTLSAVLTYWLQLTVLPEEEAYL